MANSMQMNPDLAKRLFHEGATLVIFDVPEGTRFGIDYNSWTVGPKFKGIKMIPPGFHFVFYSSVSEDKQVSSRTGFFQFFQQRQLVVRHWDKTLELSTDARVTAETYERIQQGMRDLDSSLGAYPYESLKKWVSLSNYVSQNVVIRVQPLSGHVSSVAEVHCVETATTKTSADKLSYGNLNRNQSGGLFGGVGHSPATEKHSHRTEETQFLQQHCLQPKPDSALRFIRIPDKYPKDSTPAQITHHCMDSSYMLENMLINCKDEDDLLGELQLAFICFLQGQVYDAFEHWKLLVRILCCSEGAMTTHKKLFINFISILHFQLKEIPEDFFVDIVSRSNFLTTTLQIFFSSLGESKGRIDPELVKKGLKFRDSLDKRFKWDFTSEPNEYAPTVVGD